LVPSDGVKAFWEVLIGLGGVKEPVSNSLWLDETFLRPKISGPSGAAAYVKSLWLIVFI